MKITKDNATFFQNKFNFHIGNIETTETILIDASFIIIGNLKTSKNILAEDNIIVVGDVEAKSIYACKDLLCTGIINTEICEVEGEFKVLEKNIFEKYTKLSKAEIISNRKNEDDKNKLNKKNESTQLKKSIKERKNKEYKRITEENDLNEGDIVIHNTLGEGKFISMSNDKIKINFKVDGVREISKEIAFKLELLKKEIENEEYNDGKKSLLKEEFIEKVDSSISYSNKNNTVNELKKNKKYKRITEEKDLNKGDIVIHNTLGEGKFISMSNDKIKINFKVDGVREISKEIAFKLELLKKKIENEEYNDGKKSLLKEELIDKVDSLISYANKNKKEEKNKKYKRITEENDLNKGDIVIHNTLGEGKIISISNDKIKIDFKTDGVREISKEIALKLQLLKKEIENELYNTQKKNLNKVEFIEKVDSLKGYAKNNTVNQLNENKKEEKYKKYKRITKENDLNNGDIVIHNSLGEGKFISMSNDKIKIDFKIKGVRLISKDITLKLGLLKKKIENKVSDTQNGNLSKEEFINKIDSLIDYPKKNNIVNKGNKFLNKYNKKVLKKENNSLLNAMNNQYKNKSISFYIKDINSYIIEGLDNYDMKYCIHYIKYNDSIYVRLNQICDFLNINSSIIDNCISTPIKISYYGKGINGIKFIDLNDILDNENYIYKKIGNYDYKCLLKYKRLLQILDYIRIDGNINLSNSTPYFRYVIDGILDNKKISIEELAKEWNVTVENIEFIRLGYASPLSKFRQLIKDNKVENLEENNYKIRYIKSSDINMEQFKEYKCIEEHGSDYDDDIIDYDELDIEVDKIEIISNKVYQLLEEYNYGREEIYIKNIDINDKEEYLVDIEIENLKSVSIAISHLQYISYKISDIIKKNIKLRLIEFDKIKFIAEVMEVDIKSLDIDSYNAKCYMNIDIYDIEIKEKLLEENKDYIKNLTGYIVEIKTEDENKKVINKSSKVAITKSISNIEKTDYKKTYSKARCSISLIDKNFYFIKKSEVSKLLLTKNIAFRNEEVYEFKCNKINKSYDGFTFDYIKFNDKIYARAGQISNILDLDINTFYQYLEESIKVRYVDCSVSNAKFSTLKSILIAINKIQQMHPDKKISEKRINLIEKCIDNILKESKTLEDSVPYWNLVLHHMMVDLKIEEKELQTQWEISNYDIELMKLGFSPSKDKTKKLIKQEIII